MMFFIKLKKENKMRKILSVLVVMLSVLFSQGQNTGFMGKRFFLNAELSVSPAWRNPTSPAMDVLPKYFHFNYFISPNIEAIVWKKGSVGVGYNFINTDFDSEYYYDPISFEDGNSIGYLKGHGFNVFYKQYVGETKAPLGHYFKLELDAFYFNFEPRLETILDPNADIAKLSGKSSLYGLKIEYGYDYLFFDRLRVSAGMSLGTTLGGYKAHSFDAIFFGNKINQNHLVEEYAKTRIMTAYFFQLKVGVGILLF